MYKNKFPSEVIERDGPFEEFAKDASIVSVELTNGEILPRVLLVYPDLIGGIYGVKELPFESNEVSRIFQTPENLKDRSSKAFWANSWSGFTEEKEAEQKSSADSAKRNPLS